MGEVEMMEEKYSCGCVVVNNEAIYPCEEHNKDIGDIVVKRAMELRKATGKQLIECIGDILKTHFVIQCLDREGKLIQDFGHTRIVDN